MLELEEPIVTAKVPIFLLTLHHMKIHFILKISSPNSVLQQTRQIDQIITFTIETDTNRSILTLYLTHLTILQMVDFLLQDGVCDILLSLITQIGTKQPRPSPSDAKSEALKLSYR